MAGLWCRVAGTAELLVLLSAYQTVSSQPSAPSPALKDSEQPCARCVQAHPDIPDSWLSLRHKFGILCLLLFYISQHNLTQTAQSCNCAFVLYGCETWCVPLREEHRPIVFESMVLKEILGLRGSR